MTLPNRPDFFSEFDPKILRTPYPKKKVTNATMTPIRIDIGATSSRKTDTRMLAIQYKGMAIPRCPFRRWE
jgi:hypothetical protein